MNVMARKKPTATYKKTDHPEDVEDAGAVRHHFVVHVITLCVDVITLCVDALTVYGHTNALTMYDHTRAGIYSFCYIIEHTFN